MTAERTRSKKSEGQQPPPGELTLFAQGLTGLAREVKNWEARSGDAEKFVTRRDRLVVYRDKLLRLVLSLDALSSVDAMQATHAAAIVALQSQREAARALAERCQEDSAYVTKPRAIDGLKEAELDTLETTVLSAWQTYLGAGGQSGIEVVLARFPQLRDTARRVAEARRELQGRATQLPSNTAEVEACERCRGRLAEVIARVDSSGVDEDVLSFLRASVSGVSLATLLDSEHLMSWMKEHGLASQFTVRSL